MAGGGVPVEGEEEAVPASIGNRERVGVVAAWLVGLLAVSAMSTPARAGSIRATVQSAEPIRRVWAIERRAGQLATSQGKVHDIGMYGRAHQGAVEGSKIVVEGLPVPGLYDLKIETTSGGTVVGWDSSVPESDYVGDPPLEDSSQKAILQKLADEQFSAFSDRMWVLDIQGNIQHASLLVMKLRTRPFVGGSYQPGEWVWRVERWQWENPDEHTWVPYRERPFYALVRERLYKGQYQAKRAAYARHLGGIRLTQQHDTVDLGIVKAPRIDAGVCAISPDGARIQPIVLKGPDEGLSRSSESESDRTQAGGAP